MQTLDSLVDPRIFYRLVDKTPVPCSSLEEWATWMGKNAPTLMISQTGFANAMVSTVFLGLDHNYCEKGRPILYETMVFDGPMDGIQWRYTTYENAKQGHEWLCQYIAATITAQQVRRGRQGSRYSEEKAWLDSIEKDEYGQIELASIHL